MEIRNLNQEFKTEFESLNLELKKKGKEKREHTCTLGAQFTQLPQNELADPTLLYTVRSPLRAHRPQSLFGGTRCQPLGAHCVFTDVWGRNRGVVFSLQRPSPNRTRSQSRLQSREAVISGVVMPTSRLPGCLAPLLGGPRPSGTSSSSLIRFSVGRAELQDLWLLLALAVSHTPPTYKSLARAPISHHP